MLQGAEPLARGAVPMSRWRDSSNKVGEMAATLFDQYGGFSRVSLIVSSFYDKSLDSPIVGPYFYRSDMRRIIDHQTKFVASVMGGPASYTDDMIERVHRGLGITDAAFTEMVRLMGDTLEEFGVAPDDVAVVCRELSRRMNIVVSRDSAT